MNQLLRCLFLTLLSITLVFDTQAQEDWKNFKSANYTDFGISGARGKFSTALTIYHLNSVSHKFKKLKFGYGVRVTNFIAANKYYVTAPAKYTSPIQNIFTIFSPNLTENIDTITTATAVTTSLNLDIHIEYEIAPRLEIGLNIDVIGFSFGPEKKFNIISSTFDPNQLPVQTGSPTKLNLLLTSDNDIGSLNSEFFLRYWITSRLGIRSGLTFLFSEYRTANELSFNAGQVVNDRYRHKASMALVALTYKPFN